MCTAGAHGFRPFHGIVAGSDWLWREEEKLSRRLMQEVDLPVVHCDKGPTYLSELLLE